MTTNEKTKKSRYYKIAFLSVSLMLCVSSFGMGNTSAFYNDKESTTGNTFSAGVLDFDLYNNSFKSLIGPEVFEEKSYTSIAVPADKSIPMQYTLSNRIIADPSGLCGKISVEAKLNGVSKYSGPLSGIKSATTTDFGTWEFRFDMPVETLAAEGDNCDLDAVFSAWREDTANPVNSGWHDEETLSISLTARMVVLNEIFARPIKGAIPPQNREFIELYNNGSTDVDVLGWRISEIASSTEKLYTIVTSSATSTEMQPFDSGTVVPAGGFLVLVFGNVGAEHFNNSGDTIKLYDNSSVLLDTHKYSAVAAGKSVVRFPDGIGFWVDPEPTPGASNIVSFDDLRIAGFDDSMIRELLKLASLKNVAVLTTPKNQEGQVQDTVATASTTESVFNDLLATTTPEITIESDPTATTTPEIIAESASTIPEVILTPSPSQVESGGEVVSEIISEPVIGPESIAVPENIIVEEPII